MIKTILWDVDRTLLDFDAAERAAIQSLFVEFGLGECSQEQVARYSVLNMKYWEKLERGEITKPQVLVGRFEEFFAEEGIDVSLAPQFNDAYQLRLGDTIVYRDDSYEIVKSLRGKVRQCVVSNGTVVAQTKKLTRSGLGALMDGVFLSEQLGAEKPKKEFFDQVFAAIGPVEKGETMIVGDSLTSDIRGGDNAGIVTLLVQSRGNQSAGRVTASTTRSGICTRSTACCDKKREEDIPKRIGMSSFLRLLLVLQQTDAERPDVEGLGDMRIHAGLAAVLHIYNAVH